MEKIQKCLICMKKQAIAQCSMCGTPVCNDHYDKGICVDCRRGKVVNELS